MINGKSSAELCETCTHHAHSLSRVDPVQRLHFSAALLFFIHNSLRFVNEIYDGIVSWYRLFCRIFMGVIHRIWKPRTRRLAFILLSIIVAQTFTDARNALNVIKIGQL